MELQLYNTLPEWAIKLNAGAINTPSIVVEKEVLLVTPTRDEVKTEKRSTKWDFSRLLSVDKLFI